MTLQGNTQTHSYVFALFLTCTEPPDQHHTKVLQGLFRLKQANPKTLRRSKMIWIIRCKARQWLYAILHLRHSTCSRQLQIPDPPPEAADFWTNTSVDILGERYETQKEDWSEDFTSRSASFIDEYLFLIFITLCSVYHCTRVGVSVFWKKPNVNMVSNLSVHWVIYT